MAGIVQMLHARKQSNDNYLYAHPKRVRATQPRDQNRFSTQQSATVPGHRGASVAVSTGMADTHRLSTVYHGQIHGDCSCHIWPILINLLIVIVSVTKGIAIKTVAH